MENLELTQIDLECGGGNHHRRSSAASDEDSLCFSDADENSCYSQFHSTYDEQSVAYVSDHEIGEVSESRRVSSVAASDCSVDIENGGGGESKVLHLGKVEIERDCRICHLSLVDGTNHEFGVAIELGCSCKDDLAAAHKHCAETWFKIKGNKTCEICNSIARNLIGPNVISSTRQINETNAVAANAASAPVSGTIQSQSRINGHRLLNFLLACMVFAFIISWLFHFNIPS